MAISQNPTLSALFLSDPEKAKVQVRRALKKAGGNADEAAAALNIGRRTLFRWLKKYPDIKQETAQ